MKNEVEACNTIKYGIDINDANEIAALSVEQLPFSEGAASQTINILYISDLHLSQHLAHNEIPIEDEVAVTKYVDMVVKKLLSPKNVRLIMSKGITPNNEKDLLHGYYDIFRNIHSDLSDEEVKKLTHDLTSGRNNISVTPCLKNCVCFLGDIVSDIAIFDLFFKRFTLRLKYSRYKQWKEDHSDLFFGNLKKSKKEIKAIYQKTIEGYNREIQKCRYLIQKVEKTTGKRIYGLYHGRDLNEIRRLISGRKDLPDFLIDIFEKEKTLSDEKDDFISEKEDFYEFYEKGVPSFEEVNTEHCPIYYVMGNHEYSRYFSISDACFDYNRVGLKYGISVLQNLSVEFGNCVIIGGTGFAKYNEKYNADTLIGPKNMAHNRTLEGKESDYLYEAYSSALVKSRAQNIPLLMLSHYPTSDWMRGKPSDNCYYFYGHNHQNTLICRPDCRIYADNQVGYINEDIELKRVVLGTCYNPFYGYEDGYYEISPKQYSDYYNYSGETVKTKLIRNQIEKGSTFYMIKKNGYFGFFLTDDKGTKICYGGSVKKISEVTDIRYFNELFGDMVFRYLKALLPFRQIQERIAEEVKSLNIPSYVSGTIHGCIIDVDFYHHIMLNPVDASITMYYSPVFGMVKAFTSFEELIASVEEKMTIGLGGKKELEEKMKRLPTTNVLKKSGNVIMAEVQKELISIDVRNSVYMYSRRISQLQRLFTSNILRDWNNKIIEEEFAKKANKYLPTPKKMSPYNMVRKDWKNLLLIDQNDIDIKLVKCALKKDRKCPFPYQETERLWGGIHLPINEMPEEKIAEYICHIPDEVLTETFMDFHYHLGIDLLRYFPLPLIKADDMKQVFEMYSAKRIVEVLSEIPFDKWTVDLKKQITLHINLKQKPRYCSKILWDAIQSCKANNK